MDGGWGTTFWFFKSLDINMVYTFGLYLDIYIAIVINADKISCGFYIVDKLGTCPTFFLITQDG